jgi:hypothetical protein
LKREESLALLELNILEHSAQWDFQESCQGHLLECMTRVRNLSTDTERTYITRVQLIFSLNTFRN